MPPAVSILLAESNDIVDYSFNNLLFTLILLFEFLLLWWELFVGVEKLKLILRF